jgi:GGDEF domain-containing protein
MTSNPIHPGDLAQRVHELTRARKNAAKKVTHNHTWSIFTQFISEYLRSIAPSCPDYSLESVETSQIQLVMEANEEESPFPVLANDIFVSRRGADGDADTGTPRGPGFRFVLLEDKLDTLSVQLPTLVPEQAITFLREAFGKAGSYHDNALELRRAYFLNAVTHFPTEKALDAYLEHWARSAERESAATPPALLFSGDIALFHFINKIVGNKEGDRLLTEAGMHIIRYSKGLASARPGMSWYFSNPHGDEYIWVYHNMVPSEASGVIQGMHKYLTERPFIARRIDSEEIIERPFIIPVGWMPITPRDVLDTKAYAMIRGYADSYVLRHKPEARARADAFYPESRLYSRDS